MADKDREADRLRRGEMGRKIWELRVYKGMSIAQIQAQLEADGFGKVPYSTVSSTWRRRERKAEADFDERIRKYRSFQFAALEGVYGESMRAWYRSQEGAKLAREKVSSGGPSPGRTETTQEVREHYGDPRYLDVAMRALASVRDLINLRRAPAGADPLAKFPPGMVGRVLDSLAAEFSGDGEADGPLENGMSNP
jgi:hypothetical protein